MMSIVLFIVACLFFLKLAWNVGVPFDLALRTSKMGKPASTSLMPCFAIAVWLVWMLLAFFSSGSGWLHDPKKIALWGGGAILVSYALMLGFGNLLALMDLIRTKIMRSKQGVHSHPNH